MTRRKSHFALSTFAFCKDKPALTLTLGFGPSSNIIGTTALRHGSARTLGIDAKRCPYSISNPVPSGLLGTSSTDGHYTTDFVCNDNSTVGYTTDQYPQGYGAGYWKLSKTGTITVTATLADGTAFTAKAALAGDSTWRLYAPLYGSKGLVAGFMAPDATATEDYSAEDSYWIRPALDAQHYPGDWTDPIIMGAVSPKYDPTIPGTSVVPNLQPSGAATVRFSAGLISAVASRSTTMSVAEIATNTSSDTGFYSGTFTHTDSTKPKFQGVISEQALHQPVHRLLPDHCAEAKGLHRPRRQGGAGAVSSERRETRLDERAYQRQKLSLEAKRSTSRSHRPLRPPPELEAMNGPLPIGDSGQ